MIKNIQFVARIVFIFVVMAFNSIHVNAIVATKMGKVSSCISESSGLDFTGGSSYWTHNDGYGDNKLYKISSTATLTRTVTVTGVINMDWEEITHDAARTYMFIGDFGNNSNGRTDLKIQRIQYPSTFTTSTVAASTIRFSYPDQRRFPSTWLNFDAEGFFHRNGKLYIFTKGDGTAVGYTKLYTVPDVPGTYVATLVDSFAVNGRITSACISPDGLSVVLISNTKIYLFRDFSGTNIFNGRCTKISIDGGYTQKEGVSFCSNTKICLIDEDNGVGNFLYSVDLAAYMIAPRMASEIVAEELPSFEMLAYPNPASSHTILKTDEEFENFKIVIANLTGKIIKEFYLNNPGKEIRLETDDLPIGIYAILLIGDANRRNSMLLSITR